MESMKYSPYVRHCLKELQENREFETDIIVAHMVRLQNLSERIHDTNNLEDDEGDFLLPRAPRSAYIATFQSELETIQASMGKAMRNNSKC